MSPLRVSYRSMTSGLSLTLYLIRWYIIETSSGLPRKSSAFFGNLRTSLEIFGNSRKMFGNVRLVLGTILENLRKSSENHQKRRHQHVYIIKRTLHGGFEDVNFIFSWQKQYFTHSLRSFVKCFATRK